MKGVLPDKAENKYRFNFLHENDTLLLALLLHSVILLSIVGEECIQKME
jgi:hypothetical protein